LLKNDSVLGDDAFELGRLALVLSTSLSIQWLPYNLRLEFKHWLFVLRSHEVILEFYIRWIIILLELRLFGEWPLVG